MEISVIVPVYKAETFLCRCADSILAQTFTDYELVFVDDGSPDQSGAICDRYAEKDDRIRVIHQQNGGAAAARNAGLDAAKGAWIAFVDSDDWVHPDYLRVLYEIATDQNADVVACRYEVVYDDSKVNDCGSVSPVFSSDGKEEYWIRDRIGAVVPWGKLYRRELFQDLRYPVGRTAEDEFVTHKLLFGCEKLVVIDNVIYHYNYANSSSVTHSSYLERLPDALEAFRQHEEYFENSPWQDAYRLEVGFYAESLALGIRSIKKRRDEKSRKRAAELRAELKKYMDANKDLIPYERRKKIFIMAYVRHERLVRGFGVLKGKLKHE